MQFLHTRWAGFFKIQKKILFEQRYSSILLHSNSLPPPWGNHISWRALLVSSNVHWTEGKQICHDFFFFWRGFFSFGRLYLFWVSCSVRCTWHKWAKTNENFFHFLLLQCLDVCGLSYYKEGDICEVHFANVRSSNIKANQT